MKNPLSEFSYQGFIYKPLTHPKYNTILNGSRDCLNLKTGNVEKISNKVIRKFQEFSKVRKLQ